MCIYININNKQRQQGKDYKATVAIYHSNRNRDWFVVCKVWRMRHANQLIPITQCKDHEPGSQ